MDRKAIGKSSWGDREAAELAQKKESVSWSRRDLWGESRWPTGTPFSFFGSGDLWFTDAHDGGERMSQKKSQRQMAAEGGWMLGHQNQTMPRAADPSSSLRQPAGVSLVPSEGPPRLL